MAESKVLVSNRIYWKEGAEYLSTQTHFVIDSCNADSLELIQLNEGSWETIRITVEAAEWNGKPCTKVPSYLHGPLRRKHLLLGSTIRVAIVPKIAE